MIKCSNTYPSWTPDCSLGRQIQHVLAGNYALDMSVFRCFLLYNVMIWLIGIMIYAHHVM
jgi:hypothetical protein